MISGDAVRMLYRAWRYRWKLDRAEIRFMRRQLSPGDAAVDIGAHKGAYAYWMHRAVAPAGRVVCFEPQAELAGYLGRMKTALRLDRLEVENLAVSSRAGEMTLSVPGGRPSPSGTLEAGLIEGAHATCPVRATTLDDHFGADTPVRLIKCDVEGHELEVFRGGERLLRTQRPILLFECEERHHRRYTSGEVFAFLEGLGYEGFFFARGGLRPLRAFDPARHGKPTSAEYANNFAFQARGVPR
jgi:FkbM family methyltransferase